MQGAFKMTICGIDELPEHAESGVTHILSILDPATPQPEAFRGYGRHRRLELRFHDVIEERVPDSESPQAHHIETLLGFGRDMLTEPGAEIHLLVHCHMGISRSTAAAVLILAAAEPQRPPEDIMLHVATIRSKAWPNLRMIEMGDDILGYRGGLVSAVRSRHREMARSLPRVADFMVASGRGREVE